MNDKSKVHCSFVIGKSRLAPIKPMTIPRLELQSAVLAVKVCGMLQQELQINIDNVFYWTDSQTVLCYIQSHTLRFHTFVANRIATIHEASSIKQWRYVDTKNNPADDASRGFTPKEMLQNTRWIQGPAFLWQDKECWPTMPQVIHDPLQNDKEVKGNISTCTSVVVQTITDFDKLLQHFSCWLRLKRSVAWLLVFADWLRSSKRIVRRSLDVDDIKRAELCIIKYVQSHEFAEELCALNKDKKLSKSSKIYKLEPFIDSEEILRVGGRLRAAPINGEAKHPAIIPKESHLAEMITRYYHYVETKHCGREYVLAAMRQRFWIPSARTLINKIIGQCVLCRKLKATPCSQHMADLPSDRVEFGNPPFTNTGIDCFGPYYERRGRTTEKRYGCLFTCLTTRAVHLEVLYTMDTRSFLNALSRFVCRRGVPSIIRTDNGTNFVGGNRELRDSIAKWNKSVESKGFLLQKEIKRISNPPFASHMGGIWERQIRSIRRVLDAILNKQVLDDERLQTLFCEVESIINSRPITHVSTDPNDLQPLTPNDFLQLGKGFVSSPGRFNKVDIYTNRWRHIQYLTDQFWKRWVREYLPTLQLRQKWLSHNDNVKVDDIVVIKDENTQRKCWPLGRVVQVFLGKDGLVHL